MSGRTYDIERRHKVSPDVIARQRADRLGPLDRERFMQAYWFGQKHAEQGRDPYLQYRHALDTDDSATVAGLIEGTTSVSRQVTAPQLTEDGAPVRVPRKHKLGEHEITVLMDVALGLTAQQCADKHGASLNTVLHRLRVARQRMKATSNVQAVTLALLAGEFTLTDIRERKHS